jgi:hypothetical protein
VIGTVLSLAGLVAGAVIGARIAPHLLSAGSHSRYTALAGLVGAFLGVGVCQLAAAIIGKSIRGGLRLLPPLHLLDSLGGAVLGALWGLALVWVATAVVLQVPGHKDARRDVRRSHVVRRLDRVAPPHDLLHVQKQLALIASKIGDRLQR